MSFSNEGPTDLLKSEQSGTVFAGNPQLKAKLRFAQSNELNQQLFQGDYTLLNQLIINNADARQAQMYLNTILPILPLIGDPELIAQLQGTQLLSEHHQKMLYLTALTEVFEHQDKDHSDQLQLEFLEKIHLSGVQYDASIVVLIFANYFKLQHSLSLPLLEWYLTNDKPLAYSIFSVLTAMGLLNPQLIDMMPDSSVLAASICAANNLDVCQYFFGKNKVVSPYETLYVALHNPDEQVFVFLYEKVTVEINNLDLFRHFILAVKLQKVACIKKLLLHANDMQPFHPGQHEELVTILSEYRDLAIFELLTDSQINIDWHYNDEFLLRKLIATEQYAIIKYLCEHPQPRISIFDFNCKGGIIRQMIKILSHPDLIILLQKYIPPVDLSDK